MKGSKCPKKSDINCFWERRALIELTLNTIDKKIIGIGNLTKNQNENYVTSFVCNNYFIPLIKVHPKRTTQRAKTMRFC